MSIADTLQIPTTKLDLIIRNVEIASYIPGRIRLYSRKLVNNASLADEIKQELTRYNELTEIEIGLVTGSVLIKYDPSVLRKNTALTKVEQYVMTHAKKRASRQN